MKAATDLVSGPQIEFVDQAFKQLNHRNAQINGKEFYNCSFKQCHFTETVFHSCKFLECTFIDCDLSLIKVVDCSFRSCSFKNTKLIGLNWTEALAVQFIDFDRCVLNYSIFMGIALKAAKLVNCVAREADFSETDLTQADCRYTDFSGSRFVQTVLTQADFRHASNYLIDPTSATLKKTRFSLPEAIALLYGLDIILEE